MLIYCCW